MLHSPCSQQKVTDLSVYHHQPSKIVFMQYILKLKGQSPLSMCSKVQVLREWSKAANPISDVTVTLCNGIF